MTRRLLSQLGKRIRDGRAHWDIVSTIRSTPAIQMVWTALICGALLSIPFPPKTLAQTPAAAKGGVSGAQEATHDLPTQHSGRISVTQLSTEAGCDQRSNAMCRDTPTTTYAVSVRDAKDDEEVEIETCYFVRFEGGGPFVRCLESNEPAISDGGAAGDTIPVEPDEISAVRVKIVKVEAEETFFRHQTKIEPANLTSLRPDDVIELPLIPH